MRPQNWQRRRKKKTKRGVVCNLTELSSADGGEDGCLRIGGRVTTGAAVPVGSGIWHRDCVQRPDTNPGPEPP